MQYGLFESIIITSPAGAVTNIVMSSFVCVSICRAGLSFREEAPCQTPWGPYYTLMFSNLVSAEFVLNYTKPLSVLLQTSGLDLYAASTEVRIVQEVLSEIRHTVD